MPVLRQFGRNSCQKICSALLGALIGQLPLSTSGVAFGTVLPEQYGLRPANGKITRGDAALNTWLSQHADVKPLADDREAKLAALKKSGDRIGLGYAQQFLNRSGTDSELTKENIKLAQIELVRFEKNPNDSHPLLPYLFGELAETETVSEEDRIAFGAAVRRIAPKSCPAKRLYYREVTSPKMREASTEDFLAKLKELDSFLSPRFKRQSIEALLNLAASLPPSRREEIRPGLAAAARPYDGLIRRYSWLEPEETTPISPDAFASVRRLAGKKQCKPAESEFQTILDGLKVTSAAAETNAMLSILINAGTAVDRCLRGRNGITASIQFWRNATASFTTKFGNAGRIAAEHRTAVLEWTAQNLSEAKTLLEAIRALAVSEKIAAAEAKAIYTLARIAEDERNYTLAESLYGSYIEKFPDQENYENAFQSVVTLLAMERKWEEMLKPLEKLIAAQNDLSVDERSTGLLSFSYFWAGRGHLEAGRRAKGLELWRRAAAEYYSTFYGALGHFLIEQYAGATFEVEPSRTPPFRLDALRAAFTGENKIGLDRAIALLRVGRKSEASCEISEIDISDKTPDKALAKALLLHAAGDWLDSIRIYDALPRSYRAALPSGFERLLFPRSYDDLVQSHATRLGLDPDMVFSLIRQESVFNPRAQSLVGALGLMQLMPATARLEARRLGASYLPAPRRRDISRAATSAKGILVPENNVALGVHHFHRLISKYGSPVFALAAYNASPGAADKWLKSIPTDDILVFMERIPYAETRAYVKLIMRNYFYYKRWYPAKTGYVHLSELTTGFLSVSQKGEPARDASPPSPSGSQSEDAEDVAAPEGNSDDNTSESNADQT